MFKVLLASLFLASTVYAAESAAPVKTAAPVKSEAPAKNASAAIAKSEQKSGKNFEPACLKGDKKACMRFLFVFVRNDNYQDFAKAYKEICTSKVLHVSCEEAKISSGDDMKKLTSGDPKGAFYRFEKAKPGVVFHITPMR